MRIAPRMTAFTVWVTLCGLTLVSLILTEGTAGRVSSIAVVLLAAAKCRLLIVHYMEVKRAARHWQLLYQTWVFAATAAVAMGYLVGLGSSHP